MNQKNIITILLALAAGVLGALVVCSFFFFYYKPARSAGNDRPPVESEPKQLESTPTPAPTPKPPQPEAEIREPDVSSLAIETVYKDFFPEGSKCRQTYNEMFGDKEGVYSSSSPCTITLTFDRDGHAYKSIVIRRYDKVAKEWRSTDKTVWKARISEAQFKELAETVVSNEAFKSWNDMMMINVSNCKITVKHTNGTKSPMSNVSEKTTVYLQMVNAFKALDAKISWEEDQ